MKNLLVVSCVSDDIFAPISMYLMNNFLSEVVEGAKKYALELDADIMYLLPEGQKVDGIEEVPSVESTRLRYTFWNYLKLEIDTYREYLALFYYRIKGWI